MKKGFYEIFKENTDGSLEPLVQININGVVFGPGVRFTPGVAFGGVDLHKFKGLDMEGDEVVNVWILKGFYQK